MVMFLQPKLRILVGQRHTHYYVTISHFRLLPVHCTTGRHGNPVHTCGCNSEHTSSAAHPPLSRSHVGLQYVEREVSFNIHCSPVLHSVTSSHARMNKVVN